MRLTKEIKKQALEDFSNETGNNIINADEFISWIKEKPEHPAYNVFFGKDDATLAHERRLQIFRENFGSIRVVYEVKRVDTTLMDIKMVEKPLQISPKSKRSHGGGYVNFDPEDEELMSEFRNEAAASLRSFVRRFEVAILDAGLDVESLKQMALRLEVNELQEAV